MSTQTTRVGDQARDIRGRLFRRLGQLEHEIHTIKTALGLARAELSEVRPEVPAEIQVGMYRLIAELASDLATVHATDGTCVFASPNSVAFFGWDPGELVGASVYAFCHPDDVDRLADVHAKLKVQESDHAESVTYRIRTKSGDYRWVEARCRSSPAGDGIHYAVCITRDIHDQHVARERIMTAERILASKLTKLALTDGLTGLANRRAGEERLAEEMRRSERTASPLSVLMLDLDHFKHVNDTYGHGVGDDVLRATAETIKGVVRSYDTCVRWGGEEFLVLMPDVSGENAVKMAERILAAIRGNRIPPATAVTASGGVAQYNPGEHLDHLIERADLAMYDAKNAGRDRVALSD